MANRFCMPQLDEIGLVGGELKSSFLNLEFFGMKEAATFLQLSMSAMQKISAKKTIPVYKPNNGKVYFRKEDLLNYLNAGKLRPCGQTKEVCNV